MLNHPDNALHAAGCADCQARLSLEGLDVNLDTVWTGIAAEVWARRVGPAERLAAWTLRSPGLGRALIATPSLVLSWVVATALVLALGVLATHSTDRPWFALVAPALAGVAIAYAYGPGVDPAFELSRTMVVSDRIVLLVRGLAVFGLNAVLGLVASLFASEAVGITLGWLLPMTAVAALALAASTVARSANVGVAAALSGWCIVVLGSAYPAGDMFAAVTLDSLGPAYAVSTVLLVALALYASSGRKGGAFVWQ